MKKIKLEEFTTLFTVKGVPVRFHWSLLVLVVAIVIATVTRGEFPTVVFALLFVIIAHELGHMWFASRLGLRSTHIDLYPLGGTCYYESANSEYENNLVAWGGVVAQAMIFVPALLISHFFGDNFSPTFRELFYYLGFYNAMIAGINLIPIAPLDGAKCWKTIPMYLKYGSLKKSRQRKEEAMKKYDRWRK